MKNLFTFIAIMLAFMVGTAEVNAQALDGTYTVTQGNTVTVQIGAAYQTTLARATNVSYTWTAANSSIAIQSKTSTTCTIKGVTPTSSVRLNYQCSYRYDGYARSMNFYYDITVKSNTIQVTRVDMSPEKAEMEIGETLQLSATAYPTNATNRTLNWTTENYSVASVDNSGLVTARGEGRVWIWARAKDGSGAGNYCVVDVKAPQKVESIELSATEKTIELDEFFTLTATILPENAQNKNVAWSSDNTNVATVSDGEVVAVNPGTCNIICSSTDGSNISATCAVTVKEPTKVTSIELEKEALLLNIGEMFSLEATVLPDNAYNQSVEWTTTDSRVATVEDGNITAIGDGECDIICSAMDGSGVSAACHVTVNPASRYWLTVQVPNGSYAIDVTDFEEVTLKITPDEGYKVHSVTLNGDEIVDAVNSSTITLNKLEKDATLNAVFIEDDETTTGLGYVEPDDNDVRLSVSNHTVNITGIEEDTAIYVYAINGTLVKTASEQSFELPGNAVYLIKVGSRSYKIAL